MVLLSADIASDGQFGESWLALTDERLIVVRPTGGPPTFETFPLAQIQRVRTKRYVGSGTLVVELVDRSVEVVRFSQGAYYKFSSVPQVVEAALEGPVAPDEEAVEDSLPAEAVDHCVTCGRVLRRGTKVCPHCIRKRETFTRLLTYVWPYKWTAMLGLLLALVVTALNLIPPWLNAILIGRCRHAGDGRIPQPGQSGGGRCGRARRGMAGGAGTDDTTRGGSRSARAHRHEPTRHLRRARLSEWRPFLLSGLAGPARDLRPAAPGFQLPSVSVAEFLQPPEHGPDHDPGDERHRQDAEIHHRRIPGNGGGGAHTRSASVWPCS